VVEENLTALRTEIARLALLQDDRTGARAARPKPGSRRSKR